MVNEMMDEEKKQLLGTIIYDKYSVGPFTGMIFNQHIRSGKPVEELVESALDVRLKMEKMTE